MIIQIPKWTLEDALKLIREHQSSFHEMNYHLALAGSVLNYGESSNDLDIICMSMNNEHTPDRERMLIYLFTFGTVKPASEDYNLENGRELYKISMKDGRTIDFFLYDEFIWEKEEENQSPTT